MGFRSTIDLFSNSLTDQCLVYELGSENFHVKAEKGDEMAKVIAVTVRVEDFDLSFVTKPRKTGNSVTPFLVGTVDHGSNTQDPDRQIPKEFKARAYKLAAVVLNKFRM